MRHLLSLFDVSATETQEILQIAERLQADWVAKKTSTLLAGRVMALLFSKPSLRTRVSFQAAIAHLGGSSLYLDKDVGWGHRESDADFNRVITQYLDVIVCRTGDHDILVRIAQENTCPVINGLTNLEHPCQALADLYTLRQIRQGQLSGQKVAYIGDANNVARSLAVACAQLDVAFSLAAPAKYQLEQSFIEKLRKHCPRAQIELVENPGQAVRDADIIYTDVWSSMGQESEQEERRLAFTDFQVNSRLMSQAPPTARFMHCLPARRGEEVSDEVIDGPQSIIVQQAANRMHVQKGVLAWILN